MVKSCIHTYSTVARTTSKYAIFVPLWPSSTEFRKIPRKQKFRGNEQIPRLGSKFRVPQKTVVPRYQYKQLFTGACYIDVTDTSLVSIRSHSLDHSGDFSTQCPTLPSCLASSRSLGRDWRRRPGRPHARWTDQLRNNTGSVPANHGGATQRPELATRWRWRRWHVTVV